MIKKLEESPHSTTESDFFYELELSIEDLTYFNVMYAGGTKINFVFTKTYDDMTRNSEV